MTPAADFAWNAKTAVQPGADVIAFPPKQARVAMEARARVHEQLEALPVAAGAEHFMMTGGDPTANSPQASGMAGGNSQGGWSHGGAAALDSPDRRWCLRR